MTGTATSVLAALEMAVVRAPGVGPPPPVLSWPDQIAPAEGGISTSDGGWDRTLSPHPRWTVFAGPETSWRDLGQFLNGHLATIAAPTQPIPGALDLARALLGYHAADLDLAAVLGTGQAISPQRFPGWQVGRAVTMPAEFDPSVSGPVTTDLSVWTQLAAAADPGWDALVDYRPGALSIPDPDVDRAWSEQAVAAATQLADLAAERRLAVLTNPSAEVYRTLALLAATDTAGAGQTTFLTTLINSEFNAGELALLTTLVPGAVALRACYRRLAAAAADAEVTAAIAALDTAFGFAASGLGTVDLSAVGVPTTPREIPVSNGWRGRPTRAGDRTRDANGERVDGPHELVLGRALFGGAVTTETYVGISYRGPSFVGTPDLAAATFLAAHQAEVLTGASAQLQARLAVVAAIAGNEGNLDAVRQLDGAILGLGIQQWSADTDVELSPLLWQFRQAAPDDYDAHFGVYGLELSLTTSYPDGGAQAVGLTSLAPGAAPTVMPGRTSASPGLPAQRLAFFGGDQIDATHVQFVDPSDRNLVSAWAGRVRNAGRCSRAFQLAQLLEAARRFSRIRAEGRSWAVGGTSAGVDELLTSVQGAAQLLDQHINTPGRVMGSVTRAIALTPGPARDGSGTLIDTWLAAFEANYLITVRYPAAIPKHDVIDPVSHRVLARGRQDRILAAQVSTAVHSFQGW